MGIFSFFKKKSKTEDYKSKVIESTSEKVVANIKYYVDEDGDKYMHVKGFVAMLEEYKLSVKSPDVLLTLNELTNELNKL